MEERAQHIQVTDDVEDSWTSFRDTMYAPAYETLGSTQCKHQDWFDENDEEITKLLGEKNILHRAYVSNKSSASKAAFSNARNMVQKKLQESSRTISLNTWRMACCQRTSAASKRSVEPLTWCSLHASCKKSARSRTLTCTPPSWT